MSNESIKPLVSIIVPVYNSTNYIDECLASILGNTYLNFELIIVNDGSTDDSLKKIRSFSDNRIKVIDKENGGLSSARNAGLNVANGEYIAFIDSDDVVCNNYLLFLIDEAIKYNADIVFADFIKFEEQIPKAIIKKPKSYLLSKNQFYNTENYASKAISCGKIYKKTVIGNLRFRLNKLHEDEFFYTDLFDQNFNRVVYIQSKLYFYRINHSSIMHNITITNLIHCAQAFLGRLKKFKCSNFNDCTAINLCFNALHQDLFLKRWKRHLIKKTIYIGRLYYYKYHLQKEKKVKHLVFWFFPWLPLICNVSSQILINLKIKLFNFKKILRFYYVKCVKKPCVVYLGSITHGNLGDHAICYAALKLMKKNRIRCIDLTQHEFNDRYKNWIAKKKIIIALRGGGNIGNIWQNEEQFHRDTINEFPNNKIVFFPESIYFTNDKNGHRESSISSKIYSSHKDLTLFLRDKESFNRSKSLFPKNKCYLVPDMVFYLKNLFGEPKRNFNHVAAFIFRNDLEKNISNELNISKLKKILVNKRYLIKESSTVLQDNNIVRSKRKKVLFNYLKNLSYYNLIVTDRLHGMIFAYILNVPLIVFDNNNRKVYSSFDWIKSNQKSIFYNDDVDINNYIDKINTKYEPHLNDEQNFDNYFKKIIDVINGSKGETK